MGTTNTLATSNQKIRVGSTDRLPTYILLRYNPWSLPSHITNPQEKPLLHRLPNKHNTME